MNKDIIELLLHIKENITAVETGDTSSLRLNEIESDFLEFIELIKLFLISERDTYYGYFMMNMRVQVDFHTDSIAGIRLDEFPPLFVSNPLLLCKFTLKEIIYIVCHEIDHIVFNHPAEMLKSNPDGDSQVFEEFNYAADAAVNDRIDKEIIAEKHSFMSGPEGRITSDVLGKNYNIKKIKHLENYAYYFNLIKTGSKKDENSQNGLNGPESMMGSLEGSSFGKSDAKGNDNTVVTANNTGGHFSDHNWDAGDTPEDATAVVREFMNAASNMISTEARGTMPGYFLSAVEKINKPAVLSWQQILKKYVGTISAGKRKTRMRLNRRQPERFDLSGKIDDKILKIVVAIDTSGSVSDKMIAEIFNEIFAIVSKRKHEITVIECDSVVERVYKVRTKADVKLKVAGRGGTCFSPVIEYINNDKYFRDALLIYFTDGFGESSIPKPKTYRNLWVVFNSVNNLSLKEPYGAVIALK